MKNVIRCCRRALGLGAVLAVVALAAACSDDETGADADGLIVPEAGMDVFDPPSCVAERIGRHCTANGGECGSGGMRCLITTGLEGVCVCDCEPADAESCPDPALFACGTLTVGNGLRRSYCFRRCEPRLGDRGGCEAPVACDPRSAGIIGIDQAVCHRVGCREDGDCRVVTANGCDTAAADCPGQQQCVPLVDVGTDGRCAVPGRCDPGSGLCAPREDHLNADAEVGDPCTSDVDCGAAMRCELEIDFASYKQPTGGSCGDDEECCSGSCEEGHCTAGLCPVHARNGYCVIGGCTFSATLPEFACPPRSTCNRWFAGGICMRSCDLDDAGSCRGVPPDAPGDYECRAWNRLSSSGVTLADTPLCDFGDLRPCSFWEALGINCTAFGVNDSNPTHMQCRDLSGTATDDPLSPEGYCFDDTSS